MFKKILALAILGHFSMAGALAGECVQSGFYGGIKIGGEFASKKYEKEGTVLTSSLRDILVPSSAVLTSSTAFNYKSKSKGGFVWGLIFGAQQKFERFVLGIEGSIGSSGNNREVNTLFTRVGTKFDINYKLRHGMNFGFAVTAGVITCNKVVIYTKIGFERQNFSTSKVAISGTFLTSSITSDFKIKGKTSANLLVLGLGADVYATPSVIFGVEFLAKVGAFKKMRFSSKSEEAQATRSDDLNKLLRANGVKNPKANSFSVMAQVKYLFPTGK